MSGEFPGRWTVLVHEWVTGGGLAGSPLPPSWEREGRAMRRAIARDFAALPGARVLVSLDERFDDDPGPWRCVPNGAGAEPERLGRLASEADYTVLIAPETGGILASRARVVEEASGRSLGATPEAIETTADKLRLGALLADRGIATPECLSLSPAQGLPRNFSYPAVLKPRDGAGAVNTFYLEGPGTLPDEAKGLPTVIVQPFVSGTPMSASFLVGPRGGAKLLGVGRQHVNREGVRFVYQGGTIPAPRHHLDDAPTRAVESVCGLRGFVGVDYIWNWSTRRATVLEINPRPTTSVVALTRLLGPGQLALAWIAEVEGRGEVEAAALADRVHDSRPLTFDADGTVSSHSGGEFE